MKRGKQKGKKKREKVNLVFDMDKRNEYLTGFHKRKVQRKQKNQEKFDDLVRKEKKRIKEQQKDELQKMFYSTRPLPEMEHLVNPVTYDLPNHTVTISTVSIVDMAEKNDLMIGFNKEHDSDEGGSETEAHDAKKTELLEKMKHDPRKGLSGVNHVLRKEGTKKLNNSKLLKKKMKMQSIKNSKKQHVKKKLNKKMLKKKDKYKKDLRK